MKEEKLTPTEQKDLKELRAQEEEIRKQMEFQQQMYGDKRNVEIIGMLITVLKEISFQDDKLQNNIEKKLYNKLMQHVESGDKPSKPSNLIK